MLLLCCEEESVVYLQLFEGMKAYKTTDGRVNLFRPTENMARMLSSATRSSLPVRLSQWFKSDKNYFYCLQIFNI